MTESLNSDSARPPADESLLGPEDFVVIDINQATEDELQESVPGHAARLRLRATRAMRLPAIGLLAFRHPLTLDPVPEGLLPAWTAERFASLSAALKDLGFRDGPTLALRTIGPISVCVRAMLSRDRRLVFVLTATEYRRSSGGHSLTMACWLTDQEGQRFGAATDAQDWLGGQVMHLPGADPRELVVETLARFGELEGLIQLEPEGLGDRLRELERSKEQTSSEQDLIRVMTARDRDRLAKHGVRLHDPFLRDNCRRCGDFDLSFRRPGNDGVCDSCVEAKDLERDQAIAHRRRVLKRYLLFQLVLVVFAIFGAIKLDRIVRAAIPDAPRILVLPFILVLLHVLGDQLYLALLRRREAAQQDD